MNTAPNIDWNQNVKKALDQTEFLALSTIGDDGSWACALKFGYNERGVLYFMSTPHAKHVKNLMKDKRVSATIFKTEPPSEPEGDIVGLQLTGMAERLNAREDVEEAARCYYARAPEKIDYQTEVDNHMDGVTGWNFFRIVPGELWYFDPRSFGEERVRVTLENLRLAVGS